MDAIVAVYADWGIGDGGTQPLVLRADRAHFREKTRGAAVIVGRRTLGDFPGGKPLKGRRNLVVSRQDIVIPEAEVVHSTVEALVKFRLSLDLNRCKRPWAVIFRNCARLLIPWRLSPMMKGKSLGFLPTVRSATMKDVCMIFCAALS